MADDLSLSDRVFFCHHKNVSPAPQLTLAEMTYIIFCDKTEEGSKGVCKVGAEGICQRSDEVTSRRDKDRVVLGRVLWRVVSLILIGILLASCLLLEDLDSDVRERLKSWTNSEYRAHG